MNAYIKERVFSILSLSLSLWFYVSRDASFFLGHLFMILQTVVRSNLIILSLLAYRRFGCRSNGNVSSKHRSNAASTYSSALSLQFGLAFTDRAARRFTHSWPCFEKFFIRPETASRNQWHSPDKFSARISVHAMWTQLLSGSILVLWMG